MKHLIQISICSLILTAGCLAQTAETFDIATFQPPQGWKREVNKDTIRFSTQEKNDYCLIILYKSIPGLNSPKDNFDTAWETLVKDPFSVSTAPNMFDSDNKEDWQAIGGFAPFEKNGQKGIAILFTVSGYGKMMNALVLTNTQAYEAAMTAFVESFSFKKPEGTLTAPPPANASVDTMIVGTWGQNVGASMTYGDAVAAGIAGYGKYQYTFNANGTYTFVSKTFRMSYDKIILVVENGTYQINGGTLAIKPQKSVIQAWSKLKGGDGWGRLLTTQPRKLEAVSYKFTRHYFSGIDEWNLVLQADRPTERDGPFNTFTLFPNAWYYKPISANNPVVVLPR